MKILHHSLKKSLCIATCLFSFAFADTSSSDSNSTVTVTKMSGHKKQSFQTRNSWKPYFQWAGCFEQKPSIFAEVNIGVGFLYFSDVKGNFGNVPSFRFSSYGSIPDKQDLSYNKTPLFEYQVGWSPGHWFKWSLTYQNQSNIFIQTRTLPTVNGTDITSRAQFGATLQLNALGTKLYLELPWPLIIKKLAFSPYLAGGPIASWQSWYNINTRIFQTGTGTLVGTDIPYRQKTIANIGALADLGLRVHQAKENSNFSMTLGCKYIYWGQTRNIGKQSQQESIVPENTPNFSAVQKIGLIKPFTIKALYSFAPYIGMYWNFPVEDRVLVSSKNSEPHKRFLISPACVYPKASVVAQVNIGPNFLYFSKLRANLAGRPPVLFNSVTNGAPLEGRLKSIRSPLIECVLGYRFFRWLEVDIAYLYQNETMIQSNMCYPSSLGTSNAACQFQSYLNLNAVMLKFSTNLMTATLKNMAMTPYISAGVGPSWQSWTDITVQQPQPRFIFANNFLSLRNKIIANATWMVDSGIQFRNANPNFLFSLVLGCKYTQWGQVRNLGKLSQQGGGSFGLYQPLSAKILYSWTPYIGLQWNFPTNYTYKIQAHSINTWKPFITKACNIQSRFSVMSQVNAGPGILIFDRIRGNFGGLPTAEFVQHGSSPFEGNLRYNITPVYEFILGYRCFQWFTPAIAYQTQKSIFISTQPIVGQAASTTAGAPIFSAQNQFKSHLTLDSFMLKLYFELPFPMIFKGYALSPYIGGGNGIGWQTWTDTRVYRTFQANGALSAYNQAIRQKIMANYVWMAEAGFRVRNASPNFPFSGVFGCKYIQWGQTRNIGKQDQQANNQKFGLRVPFRIRVLGSITPYVGLQWNF